MTRGALAAHARTVAGAFDLQASDRVLQIASPSFDVALEEVFPTWLAGAAVVLPDDGEAASIAALLRRVADDSVTVVNLPAATFNAWTDDVKTGARVPDSLRLVVVGSDRVAARALRVWRRLPGAERVRFLNAYGTSETTITSTIWSDDAARLHDAILPIGQPLDGGRVHLIGAESEQRGEIAIAGKGPGAWLPRASGSDRRALRSRSILASWRRASLPDRRPGDPSRWRALFPGASRRPGQDPRRPDRAG